ncbi:hypothetical protein [Duganella radicis]|uniref:Yip1 domain-containing protein n=1 Tax=Duganella radicis TaxID=551988 RepID=A0A6L6PD42_9BURK|nr:hypothetical protein [Duganella radicis]MTV36511.1 hypothetical protein [Duganella radicis]
MSSDDSLRAIPGAESSPSVFSPHRLVSLLLTPRAYFAQPDLLADQRGILLAAAIVGMADVMGRIDQNLLKADFRNAEAGAEGLAGWIASSWMHYWIVVLVAGLFSAVISWYFRGWWYRKRLEWSGVAEVAPERARAVSTLQGLVYVLPLMVWTLVDSFSYDNYIEAWQSTNINGIVLLMFLLWSCWTSYCAATTAFAANKNPARIWFLILPLLFYLILMGGIAIIWATLR